MPYPSAMSWINVLNAIVDRHAAHEDSQALLPSPAMRTFYLDQSFKLIPDLVRRAAAASINAVNVADRAAPGHP